MPNKSEDVLKSLQPIADALKVAVTEIWKIFVKRYVAKGVSELLVAGTITAVSIVKLGHTNWMFLPLSIALVIAYDAVNLVINPAYFAIADIVERVKDESNKSESSRS